VFGYSLVTQLHHGVGPGGTPLFYDFSAFYEAGTFAHTGHAALAYDDSIMVAAERAAFPGTTARLPWNYPPTFQLALVPLAALPYVAAWLVWSGLVVGFYMLTARRLFEPQHFLLMALAPAVAVNLMVGQNGLLTTALIGTGVLLISSRPIAAGVVLGFLAYKPQVAVLAPLALLFGREWRTLAAAVISQTTIIVFSTLVLGADAWIAFFHKATQPEALFTSSSSSWLAIPSVMIFARSLHLPAVVCAALHWTIAIAAAAAALWVWNRRTDVRLRAGALAAATLLVTPYLRPYDLALLILPIAALLPHRVERMGLGAWSAIAAAWLVPGILTFSNPQIQYGALVTATVLALVVRRAARPPIGNELDQSDALPQAA
jgi:hypothetical protein